MISNVLEIKEEDEFVVLTLNRPEKRNALNKALRSELHQALDTFQDLKKAIIITGNGKVFCAGLDLKDNPDKQALDEFWSLIQRIKMRRSIIIGAINGIAIGGGLIITNICDIAIGAHDSRYGMPDVNTERYPSLQNPLSKLKEGKYGQPWIDITGKLINAQEALELEIINHVSTSGSLIQDVYSFAKKICKHNKSDLVNAKDEIYTSWQKIDQPRESFVLGKRNERDFRKKLS